jgi:phosphoribosylaminoimidazole (AIR) synthetase
MVLVVPEAQAAAVIDALRGLGEDACRIGRIVAGKPDEEPLYYL